MEPIPAEKPTGNRGPARKSQGFYEAVRDVARNDRSRYPAMDRVASVFDTISLLVRMCLVLFLVLIAIQTNTGVVPPLMGLVIGVAGLVQFLIASIACKAAGETLRILIDIERNQRASMEGVLHIVKVLEPPTTASGRSPAA